MIHESIRGGVTVTTHRMATANNRYLDSFKPDEPISYLGYFDANALYASCMVEPLPYANFKMLYGMQIEGILNLIQEYPSIGFFIECDIECPPAQHNRYILMMLFSF